MRRPRRRGPACLPWPRRHGWASGFVEKYHCRTWDSCHSHDRGVHRRCGARPSVLRPGARWRRPEVRDTEANGEDAKRREWEASPFSSGKHRRFMCDRRPGERNRLGRGPGRSRGQMGEVLSRCASRPRLRGNARFRGRIPSRFERIAASTLSSLAPRPRRPAPIRRMSRPIPAAGYCSPEKRWTNRRAPARRAAPSAVSDQVAPGSGIRSRSTGGEDDAVAARSCVSRTPPPPLAGRPASWRSGGAHPRGSRPRGSGHQAAGRV